MNDTIEIMPWPDKSFFSGDLEFPEEAAEKPIILDCTEADYHRIRAFSSSYLKSLVDSTPHHALTPVKENDAMKVGTGFECLVEEAFQLPETEAHDLMGKQRLHNRFKFQDRCCVKPPDLHKGEGARARAAEWRERNKGKTELSMEQLMTCTEMVKSAMQNSGWRRHLRGSWQTVILWVEDGLPMKAMIDHQYVQMNKFVLIDVKTIAAASAEEHQFSKRVANLQYDLQAAHYLTGAARMWGEDRVAAWIWLVMEQKAPHGSAVYAADDEMLATGFAQREKAIKNLKQFILSANVVSGYPVYTTHDQLLSPPKFHSFRHQLEEIDG